MLKIGNHLIGVSEPTFIIAEGCSNVIRYLNHLETFIQAIAKAGARAAKIQLFKAEHFPAAEQRQKKLFEFPRNRLRDFISLCHKHNLYAGASVFDIEAVELLEAYGADYIKVAVREWENINLWQRVAESPLPIIASFDCTAIDELPWANHTVHLACVPRYPNVSLRIPNYRGSMWGWSSHYVKNDRCLDILLAVSHGACVIERHFGLSEADFEAGWSSTPEEFGQMVRDVKRIDEGG